MLNNFRLSVTTCLLIAAVICCALQRVQIIRTRAQLQAAEIRERVEQAQYAAETKRLQDTLKNANENTKNIDRKMGAIVIEPLGNSCEKIIGYAREYVKQYQRDY